MESVTDERPLHFFKGVDMLPFVTIMGRSLPMYAVMGISGFLLGLLFALLRAQRFGLSRDDAAYIYVFAVLGALVGAKLVYIITVLPEISSVSELAAHLRGGFVFFGGVLGAVPAAYLSARAYRVRLRDLMPVLVSCIAIIGCLGRVGCLCAGCCWGVESCSPLAVVFPEGSLGAPAGVRLLPVQLFEAAVQLALFFLLLWFTSERRRAQYAAELYLLCYCPARFVLEFFRGDTERGFLLGLSTSQWLAILVFFAVSLYIFICKRLKKPD